MAPPLAAFAVARGLLWAASASTGRGWPGAADLSRHDTFLYLGIAKHGYTLFTCPRPGGWCGNAGWFPLFPLLVVVLGAGWADRRGNTWKRLLWRFVPLLVLSIVGQYYWTDILWRFVPPSDYPP